MQHRDLITEQEQEEQRLYFVHHMHHYKDGEDTTHELHHCFLFSEPNMEGEKYTIEHLISEGELHHILNKKPEEVVYDHANNSFKTKEIELENKKYYTFC